MGSNDFLVDVIEGIPSFLLRALLNSAKIRTRRDDVTTKKRTPPFFEARPGGAIVGLESRMPWALLQYAPSLLSPLGEHSTRQRLRRWKLLKYRWWTAQQQRQWASTSSTRRGDGGLVGSVNEWISTTSVATFLMGAIFALLVRAYVWSLRHLPVHLYLDRVDHCRARPISSTVSVKIVRLTSLPSDSHISIYQGSSTPAMPLLTSLRGSGLTSGDCQLIARLPSPFPTFSTKELPLALPASAFTTAGSSTAVVPQRVRRLPKRPRRSVTVAASQWRWGALSLFSVGMHQVQSRLAEAFGWLAGGGYTLNGNVAGDGKSSSIVAKTSPSETAVVKVLNSPPLVKLQNLSLDREGRVKSLECAYPFQNRVLRRRGYALGFSDAYGVAMWCSYQLSQLSLTCGGRSSSTRTESFLADPDVPASSRLSAKSFSPTTAAPACNPSSFQVVDDDGDGDGDGVSSSALRGRSTSSPPIVPTKGWSSVSTAGTLRYSQPFDRGHLAPRASVGYSPLSAKDSFYLSNVQVQTPYSNRVLMRKVEGFARKMASGDRTEEVVLQIVGDAAETTDTAGKKASSGGDPRVSVVVDGDDTTSGGKPSGATRQGVRRGKRSKTQKGKSKIDSEAAVAMSPSSTDALHEYRLLARSAVGSPVLRRKLAARMWASLKFMRTTLFAHVPAALSSRWKGGDSAEAPITDEEHATAQSRKQMLLESARRRRASNVAVCVGPLFDKPPSRVARLPSPHRSNADGHSDASKQTSTVHSPPVPVAFFCALMNSSTQHSVAFIVPNCPNSRTPFAGSRGATKHSTATSACGTSFTGQTAPSHLAASSQKHDSCPARRKLRQLAKSHKLELAALTKLTVNSADLTQLPADPRWVEYHVNNISSLREELVTFLRTSLTTTVVLPPKVLERLMGMLYAHSLDQEYAERTRAKIDHQQQRAKSPSVSHGHKHQSKVHSKVHHPQDGNDGDLLGDAHQVFNVSRVRLFGLLRSHQAPK